MSNVKEGMHLVKEARRTTGKMRHGLVTAEAPDKNGVQGGAQVVQFERKFDARDAYDDEMNTKMQLMDKEGMTPFGQVFFDDKTGRWLERKAAVAEAANFDAYFNKEFNKNDLASRQWAQSINPDFYKAREDEMNEKAEVILRLKKIQLRGPQDKEDLYMLWLIESGQVELPAGWDRLGPSYDSDFNKNTLAAQNEKSFVQGLIRLPLFKVWGERDRNALNNGAVGAWGNEKSADMPFGVGEGANLDRPRVFSAQNRPLSQPGKLWKDSNNTQSSNATYESNVVRFLKK